MADARSEWKETGDKLNELGRKLKVHYDVQHGEQSQATRDELTDAARKLGSTVQDAFEAIGTAARDKAVKDDVKKVGQSLAEALGATLGQAADELRRAFSERKGATGDVPPAAGPPTPEPVADATPPDGEQPPKVEPWGTP